MSTHSAFWRPQKKTFFFKVEASRLQPNSRTFVSFVDNDDEKRFACVKKVIFFVLIVTLRSFFSLVRAFHLISLSIIVHCLSGGERWLMARSVLLHFGFFSFRGKKGKKIGFLLARLLLALSRIELKFFFGFVWTFCCAQISIRSKCRHKQYLIWQSWKSYKSRPPLQSKKCSAEKKKCSKTLNEKMSRSSATTRKRSRTTAIYVCASSRKKKLWNHQRKKRE